VRAVFGAVVGAGRGHAAVGAREGRAALPGAHGCRRRCCGPNGIGRARPRDAHVPGDSEMPAWRVARQVVKMKSAQTTRRYPGAKSGLRTLCAVHCAVGLLARPVQRGPPGRYAATTRMSESSDAMQHLQRAFAMSSDAMQGAKALRRGGCMRQPVALVMARGGRCRVAPRAKRSSGLGACWAHGRSGLLGC
jgi:hypothetical protein